jgi:hypothetical protein
VNITASAPSAGRLFASFDRWLHAPADLHAAALVRILVGGLVAVNFLAAAPFVTLWWGEHGVLPRAVARLFVSPASLSVFDVLPATDGILWVCWAFALTHALLLAVGFHSRIQAACLFAWLVSFQHRNNLILDSEDSLFRLFSFYLIFIPAASDLCSVDAWLRRRRGQAAPGPRSGWGLRLVQWQVCLVLAAAGLAKLDGPMWREGSAMYTIFQLDDFSFRGPVPDLIRQSLWCSRAFSWTTVAIELSVPVLIWFEETRRMALVAVLLLHIGIEYSMNLFLFQWIMIAGWMAHARREDWTWLRSISSALRARVTLERP